MYSSNLYNRRVDRILLHYVNSDICDIIHEYNDDSDPYYLLSFYHKGINNTKLEKEGWCTIVNFSNIKNTIRDFISDEFYGSIYDTFYEEHCIEFHSNDTDFEKCDKCYIKIEPKLWNERVDEYTEKFYNNNYQFEEVTDYEFEMKEIDEIDGLRFDIAEEY